MQIDISGRRNGKTIRLIKHAAENHSTIICLTQREAQIIQDVAKKMGIDILKPMTLDEYLAFGMRGQKENHVVIDNADLVLQRIFFDVTIDRITITSQEAEDGI